MITDANINDERYVIRDIITKEPLKIYGDVLIYRSLWAANQYISGVRFGLGEFLEIFDMHTQKIIYTNTNTANYLKGTGTL